MLHHVSIGVKNIPLKKTFYDAALAPLGYTCQRARETWLGYGANRTVFSVRLTQSPVKTDPNSGLHFCFIAPTRKSVEEFYEAALANGGKGNGEPSLRLDYAPTYFSAYVVDPDGYRLEAYCGTEV